MNLLTSEKKCKTTSKLQLHKMTSTTKRTSFAFPTFHTPTHEEAAYAPPKSAIEPNPRKIQNRSLKIRKSQSVTKIPLASFDLCQSIVETEELDKAVNNVKKPIIGPQPQPNDEKLQKEMTPKSGEAQHQKAILVKGLKFKPGSTEIKRNRNKTPKKIQTVSPPNTENSEKNAIKSIATAARRPITHVVLSPRFMDVEGSGMLQDGTIGDSPRRRPRTRRPPSPIDSENLSSEGETFRYVFRISKGLFPPEKALWVQRAIEKLVLNATISENMINKDGFVKKIGELYDVALDKRYVNVSTGVNHIISGNIPSSTITPTTPNEKRTTKKSKPLKNSSKSTRLIKTPVATKTLSNDVHEIERKASDILLHLLLKGMLAENNGQLPSGDAASSEKSEMVSVGINTDDENDDWTWITPGGKKKLISTVPSAWIQKNENVVDIWNCFVFEGKICPIEFAQKPASSFATFAESRRKLEPDTSTYFRRIVDVRGFQSDEIIIKYSKTRIFVEGKQQAIGDKNYRIVREIIQLPSGLDIVDLKIMRGKKNGRLIFEEIKASSQPTLPENSSIIVN